MINSVNLTGRLTKDPELRYTPNGVPVANITLAVNRPFKNSDGEQEADFIMIVAWRTVAEIMANHLKKGSLIGVTGRIQSRVFEGQDGKNVYVTEVLAEQFSFLEGKKDEQPSQNGGQNNGKTGQYQSKYNKR